MEFRLDKRAKIVLKKGKSVHSRNLVTTSINRENTANSLERKTPTGTLALKEENVLIKNWKTEKKWVHREIKNDTEINVECKE